VKPNQREINRQLYGAACAYLAIREHGSKELVKKLTKKYPEANSKEITLVIERLQEKNFQSDKRYTELLIKSRFNKGYGLNMIRAYVLGKDVDMSMFDQIFYSMNLDLDKSCLEFISKFSHKPKDKLMRKALNRGFSFDQVKQSMKKLEIQNEYML
jgi:regulatory protein